MVGSEKGFTLIELMVVVLIVGILVTIALPVYGGTVVRARDRACRNNLRTLDGSSVQYQAQYGVWPADVDALVISRYLQAKPRDPHEGGTDYTIDLTGVAHANGPPDHVVYR